MNKKHFLKIGAFNRNEYLKGNILINDVLVIHEVTNIKIKHESIFFYNKNNELLVNMDLNSLVSIDCI